ncbi:MAG TPA: 23S rRNA (pseudouridine(1915)-N(3))-methyltransferase RlmH [Chitinispirillaceae bacterium]|nr:23S rRNA (pseudouridine(1915)-N(3))-methyltransferase RlmH [Chitinispirillaceae bacterium]
MSLTALLIRLIVVGKIKDHCLLTKIDEYKRRISYESRLEIVEIQDSSPEIEALKIKQILSKDPGFVIALSEEGRELDSVSFAGKLANINGRISFIIGGPCGLSKEIKSLSREVMSLSRMTFTHEMARLLLLEQIYRAGTIINNRKYHRN